VIDGYGDFVAASEPDDRNIPEALYCIALEYFEIKNKEKAEEYYQKAVKSESPTIRLPCFGPISENFPPKSVLKVYFDLKKKHPPKPETGGGPKPDVCRNCGKSGQLRQCGNCKQVKYCNRNCQKEDWKEHKKNCK
jgi:hypothetical protein